MTDKTPTPTPAVVPTFGVWFRVHNPPTTLAVIVLAQIAGAYFGMAIVRSIGRDNPFPSLQDFLPLLGFIVVLELGLTYWRYRRFTKARRDANLAYGQTAEGGATKTTTGSGSDSPIVPVTVPAIDGKDSDSPSTGGHSPSGGKGGGGTDSSGDTGGSDGGGAGGE